MKLLRALRGYAADTFAIGKAAEGDLRLKPHNLVIGLSAREKEGIR
jgi:hypothetical protein